MGSAGSADAERGELEEFSGAGSARVRTVEAGRDIVVWMLRFRKSRNRTEAKGGRWADDC